MPPLMPVAEARERILEGFTLGPVECVPLARGLGRSLARPVSAKRSQPPADVSAMDGYAVRSADLSVLPKALRVIGETAAGQRACPILGQYEAVRIFTGGLMPTGGDMVALQENATRIGGEVVIERGEVSIGKHVRKAGGDFKAGDVTLSEGLCLSARHMALLSAMNHANVEVVRKPRIGVLATGDELVRPGGILGPAQIVAASLDGLLAQIEAWGGEAIDLGIAPDHRAAILAAACRDDLDALVTLGGASVGDHDLVKQALSEGGLDVGFWKIAMRPGKPLISGTFRGRPFLGLPGNPVSAMICALLFLKPGIFKALGRCGPVWTFGQRPLAVPLPPNDEREDYLRARLVEGLVVPDPVQDSGQLLPLAKADVLALRPPHDPAKLPGSLIDVIFLDQD